MDKREIATAAESETATATESETEGDTVSGRLLPRTPIALDYLRASFCSCAPRALGALGEAQEQKEALRESSERKGVQREQGTLQRDSGPDQEAPAGLGLVEGSDPHSLSSRSD